jgi:hypothetical protein
LEWSRPAQAKAIALALERGVIGHVSRYSSGLWLCWNGDNVSRHILARRGGKHVLWTAEEDVALRSYYPRIAQRGNR